MLFLIPIVSAPAQVTTVLSTNTNIQIISIPFNVVKQYSPLYVRFWAFNGSSGVLLTNSSIYCTLNLFEPLGKNIMRAELRDTHFGINSPSSCRNCFWYNISGGNLSVLGENALNIRCQTHDNVSLGGDSIIPLEVSSYGFVSYETQNFLNEESKLNILIFSIFLGIVVIFLYLMGQAEEKGARVAYGWFGAAFAWIESSMMLAGWRPFSSGIIFLFSANTYVALLLIMLGLYAAAYSVFMTGEMRGQYGRGEL